MAKKDKKTVGADPTGGSREVSPADCATAYILCELGGSLDELAAAFTISQATLRDWLSNKSFAEACKAGQKASKKPNQLVEDALFKAAIGHDHMAEKVAFHKGEVIRAKVKVHVPPDTAAAKFWLINMSNPCWQSNPDPKKVESIDDWVRAARREQFRFRTILDPLNSAGDDDNTSDDHPEEPNDHDDEDGA